MMLRYGKEYNKTIEGLKTEFTNKINEYIGTKLTRKDIVLTYSPCLKAGDSWIQTILAY